MLSVLLFAFCFGGAEYDSHVVVKFLEPCHRLEMIYNHRTKKCSGFLAVPRQILNTFVLELYRQDTIHYRP